MNYITCNILYQMLSPLREDCIFLIFISLTVPNVE